MNTNYFSFLYIIFFSIIKDIFSENSNCISDISKFDKRHTRKCKSLSSGYNICLEEEGIFTYNSELTKVLNYYIFNFTLVNNIDIMTSLIVEFKEVENKNDHIIICFLSSSYLFFFSNEGEFILEYIFHTKLTTNYYFTITPYKFEKDKKEYYYIIGSNESPKIVYLYCKINLIENINQIIYQHDYLPNFMREGTSVDSYGNSCEVLLDKELNEVLTCFFVSKSNNYYISSVSFLPENNFSTIYNLTYNISNLFPGDIMKIVSSKYNKTKALVCYHKKSNGAGCFVYNTTDYSMSSIIFNYSDCSSRLYGSDIYYFDDKKEFIFSCQDGRETMHLAKISQDLNYFDEYNMETYKYNNCNDQTGFSIIYLKNLNIYSIILIMIYNNKYSIVTHLLTNEINCNNTIKYLNFSKYSEINDKVKASNTIEAIKKSDLTQISESMNIHDSISQITGSSFINQLSTISEYTQMDESLQTIESTQIIDTPKNFESSILNESSQLFESTNLIKTNQIDDSRLIQTTELGQTIEQTQTIDINSISDENIMTEKIQEKELFVISDSNETTEINRISDTIQKTSIFDEKIENKETSKITNIINFTNIIDSKIIKSDELTQNIESEYITEDYFKCSEKCSECDEKSNINDLCIKCNNQNNYYELRSSNKETNEKSIYVACYSQNTKPQNYFLNNNFFEECYYTCGSCIEKGNQDDNKCLTCSSNYIIDPNHINNCVIKCKYYYYYTDYGEYKCSYDNQCPEEASLLLPELSKCTKNCKDEIYKFQYNGQCIDKCPEDTSPNKETNVCEIKNINVCTYNLLYLFLYNDIMKNNIENIVVNYAKEYSYTNNHISNYISDEYSIIIYKNSACIKKLGLNMPTINFGTCYDKVKDHYSIKVDLIIGVIDVFPDEESNNKETTFALFHPDTGKNLNASEICQHEKIIVEENILSIIDNNETILFFSDQNVNLFNISNEFYTDICFPFDSHNQRDISRKDRIQLFYPNVTLCDKGCKNIGINLTSISAICECSFKELLEKSVLNNDFFSENILISEVVGEIQELIILLNLEVMSCYELIFKFNYFIRCTGGFIVLIIIVFEIICIIVYTKFSKKAVIGFLFNMSTNYISFVNINSKKEKPIQKLKFGNPAKKNKSSISHLLKNKKSNSISKKKNINININMAQININKISPKKIKNNILILKSKKFAIQKNKNKRKQFSHKEEKIKSKSINQDFSCKNLKDFKTKNGLSIKKYLETPYEEMDFDDAIIKEKRRFWKCFIDRLKSNHIFINTFFVIDNMNPKSIKIFLFLANIDFYLLINSMVFNEDSISQLYHIENKNNFIGFIKRSVNRFIYTVFATSIYNYISKFFFIKEKKFIKLLLRHKSSHIQLYQELYLFTIKLKNRYKGLIIICMIINIFSWYYISCFNNVYRYTKREWLLSSFCFIIANMIFHLLTIFFGTILRYISFKFDSEKLYKIGNLISGF